MSEERRVAGGRASPATTKLRNKARSMAEGRFIALNRQEWLNLLIASRELDPPLGKHAQRNWALKRLRGAHRLQWAQIMSRAVDLLKAQHGWMDGRIANGLSAGRRPEYAIKCSYCGSPVNEPCRKPSGQYSQSHTARVRAVPEAA